MQVFCFSYPTGVFSEYFLRQAYFARRGRLPVRSDVSIEPLSPERGLLKIAVDWNEAGTIHVPFLHKQYGLTFFSTETLRPQKEPIPLLRELVRSQLSRVMKRLYDWSCRGLRIPPFLIDAVRESLCRMTKLLVMDHHAPEFDAAALNLFESLVVLAHRLLDQFIDQSLAARKTQAEDYPIFLGFCGKKTNRLTEFAQTHPDYQYLFEAWNPALTWRDIEPEEGVFCWNRIDEAVETAQKNYWKLVLGPLVRWNLASLPHWIIQRLDNPYFVRKALFRYADTLIRRFRQTEYWILFEGIESELDSILVTKRIDWADSLARTVRSLNPSAKIFTGFSHPWGDSLRFATEIPPMEVAERLAMYRDIDGFFLHLELGLASEATLPRDAFDLNTLLDGWNQFGKPLYISFSVPSAPSYDMPLWETPNTQNLAWTVKTQQETVHRFFLSFLTRKSVQAIFWNQMNDLPIPKIPPALTENAEISAGTNSTGTNNTGANSTGLNSIGPNNTGPNRAGSNISPNTVPLPPPILGKTAILPVTVDREKTPDQVAAYSLPPAPVPPEIPIPDTDSDPQTVHFPHSGLLTVEGKAKPAFKKLAALQRAYM